MSRSHWWLFCKRNIYTRVHLFKLECFGFHSTIGPLLGTYSGSLSMLQGFPPPHVIAFPRLTERDTRDTGEPNSQMNERITKHVTTTLYNKECTLSFSHWMYTIKATIKTVMDIPWTPFFTELRSKRDQTNSTKYGITHWHPQASQWPKPAYHSKSSSSLHISSFASSSSSTKPYLLLLPPSLLYSSPPPALSSSFKSSSSSDSSSVESITIARYSYSNVFSSEAAHPRWILQCPWVVLSLVVPPQLPSLQVGLLGFLNLQPYWWFLLTHLGSTPCMANDIIHIVSPFFTRPIPSNTFDYSTTINLYIHIEKSCHFIGPTKDNNGIYVFTLFPPLRSYPHF